MHSPYKKFYQEIPRILKSGPMAHRSIARELKRILPMYCDDSIPCPHVKDNSGHPEWNHLARSAEQGLKRNGIISYNHGIRKWELA
ncbi:hypothetical protein [Desulfococcus sp.]|uniref:hypothetical protein n=1 Tax=Desulfococcus sp. TaxID=2025834 RepID=UPI0035934794